MIEILPESSGNLLAIKGTDKLTANDYETVFIPALTRLIAEYKKIKVLFYLGEHFHGWELGAAWDDAKFGMSHSKDFAKVALVGGPKWVTWATKVSAHFFKCQVETFEHDDFKTALEWIKS
jgi:SpoIIAA-like